MTSLFVTVHCKWKRVSTFNVNLLLHLFQFILFIYALLSSSFLQALLNYWRVGLFRVSTFNVNILLGPLHRKLFLYWFEQLEGRLGMSLLLVW